MYEINNFSEKNIAKNNTHKIKQKNNLNIRTFFCAFSSRPHSKGGDDGQGEGEEGEDQGGTCCCTKGQDEEGCPSQKEDR
jgi:hypothetical protein